jgi:hypothetical protein
MRMVRPLLESSMEPTSLGYAEQRLHRDGSLVSGSVIVFVLNASSPTLTMQQSVNQARSSFQASVVGTGKWFRPELYSLAKEV